MDPAIWGPPAWKFLHLLTLNYPNSPSFEDKYKYKEFIIALQRILPCYTCSQHFEKKIKETNFNDILKSRESLFEWFVDVHNDVNKQNNKKQWSYMEVYKNLQHSSTPQNNSNTIKKKYYFIWFLKFIFISMMLWYISTNYYKYK